MSGERLSSWIARLSLFAFTAAVIGCGGSSSTTGATTGPTSGTTGPATQFYRGTVSLESPFPLVTNHPAVLNLNPDGSFQAFWMGSAAGDLGFTNGSGVILTNNVSAQGTARINSSAGVFSFLALSGGQSVASGIFQSAALPAVGAQTAVPAAGTYAGELLVFTQGGVAGLGTVSAVVQANGKFTITASAVGNLLGSGDFMGTFAPAGVISGGVCVVNEGVYVQPNSSPYSWDGHTLVARMDCLPLQPGSAWMTMTYVSTSTAIGRPASRAAIPDR